ncbi:phage holin family protein [Serinicoccus sediminis]|uniref:phage holin family protein n=1 Tax=Serinicoccus sediminis TaxID=2306021 RepID=UPI00101F953B|nr:phage holin family protein [Serinicoccus sediminis]
MSTPAKTDSTAPATSADKRSLGQLVSDVTLDVSQIMRGEIELAKAEIKQDVTHAGKGAGMFAGAALFGLYGLGLLFLGLAGVLAIWLPWWASLLIVAAVLFVVAGILALVGKGQVTKVNGKPEKAIREGKETVETVKAAAQGQHRSAALETARD